MPAQDQKVTRLFYIQRNISPHWIVSVDYDNKRKKVFCYWFNTKDDSTSPITKLQKKLFYGITEIKHNNERLFSLSAIPNIYFNHKGFAQGKGRITKIMIDISFIAGVTQIKVYTKQGNSFNVKVPSKRSWIKNAPKILSEYCWEK